MILLKNNLDNHVCVIKFLVKSFSRFSLKSFRFHHSVVPHQVFSKDHASTFFSPEFIIFFSNILNLPFAYSEPFITAGSISAPLHPFVAINIRCFQSRRERSRVRPRPASRSYIQRAHTAHCDAAKAHLIVCLFCDIFSNSRRC